MDSGAEASGEQESRAAEEQEALVLSWATQGGLQAGARRQVPVGNALCAEGWNSGAAVSHPRPSCLSWKGIAPVQT